MTAVAGDPGGALIPRGPAAAEAPPAAPQAPHEARTEPRIPESVPTPVPMAAPEEPSAAIPAAAPAEAAPEAGYEAEAAPPGFGGAEAEGAQAHPGSPKKPMLAAAAIVGALLISVPFLLSSHGDSRPSSVVGAVASPTDGTVLATEQPGAPAGGYVSSSPSASPSVSASPEHGAAAKTKTTPKASAKAAGAAKAAEVKTSSAPRATVGGNTPTAAAAAKSTAKAITAPVGTAAYAVQKLAASSSGRHICYRAYVTDIGWQSPVCDGALAGTTGQSRAIEALNIAVSGTGGTGANGYMQDTGWESAWKGAANGANLTIGSPGKSLRMEAFAMNVGVGTVCVNAHVQNLGWQGKKCDVPGNWVTGGTTGQSLRLEAVEITV
jgi:hypothetical protein